MVSVFEQVGRTLAMYVISPRDALMKPLISDEPSLFFGFPFSLTRTSCMSFMVSCELVPMTNRVAFLVKAIGPVVRGFRLPAVSLLMMSKASIPHMSSLGLGSLVPVASATCAVWCSVVMCFNQACYGQT